MQYDFEPLLPERDYQVTYHSHALKNMFGRSTLLLRFTLAEMTDHENAVLTKYYPIRSFNKKGGFSVKKSQEFARFWYSIFPSHDFTRLDRFPLSKLKGLVLLAKVATRTRDKDGNDIPPPLRQSKIESLFPI